jgi:hypothetical protein
MFLFQVFSKENHTIFHFDFLFLKASNEKLWDLVPDQPAVAVSNNKKGSPLIFCDVPRYRTNKNLNLT